MSTGIKIIDSNYFFNPSVTITASSEDTNFPSTNLKHQIRSKIWRSNVANGTFVITTSNNKIDFDEGVGPLVATITVGTYTTSTLITEIKTQLEAVGAEVYTITHSSGKWSIAHAGGTLSLLWLSGANTANSIGPTLGFSVIDHSGLTSYTASSIAIHTEESITIDLKTAEEIDSLVMLFDPFIGNRLSSLAEVRLQANPVNDWSAPLVDVALVLDEQEEMFSRFVTTPEEYRYWRIKIIDPSNINKQVELGKIVLGKALTLTQGPEIGFKRRIDDQSKTQSTDFGHEYADIYPNRKEFKFDFKTIDLADSNTLSESYERAGNTEIVMVVLDPTETLFDKDKFSVYGKYRGQFEDKQVFLNYFDTDLAIREVF